MDSKYRGKSIISVNVLSLACIILLIALHHQISYFLIYHVDGFEFGAHYFQSELMNLQIVVIRLSVSVGNVIQRNVSSSRKRSPTSGACSTQREFPLPSENMNGINLVNFPGILRLKFYRATLLEQKVYFHVTKTITWFGIEEKNMALLPNSVWNL